MSAPGTAVENWSVEVWIGSFFWTLNFESCPALGAVALPVSADILAPMFRSTSLPAVGTGVLCLGCAVLLTLGGAAVPAATAQARIEGTVGLPAGGGKAVAKERYQVAGGKIGAPPPQVAVVYLEGEFPSAGSTPAKAEMWQKNFQFAPAVLPVQKGGTVEFPNADDGYHNVFSYSKPKRFDLGRYRKDEQPAAVVFDQPGTVKLYCEIHEHMRATILVLDTPHFTSTDAAGKFVLTNLPAGQFTLKAWLDDKQVLEKPVTLKEGETLRVDFPAP
jgi:plastocyanin